MKSKVFSILILSVLILISVVVLQEYFFLAHDVFSEPYMPTFHKLFNDEFGYFINAKSFFQNLVLGGTFLHCEKAALVFEAGGHGFAYQLTNGLIAKIFGFNAYNIVLTNIFFLLASIVIIFFQKLKITQKITISLLILLYFTVPIFLFTYMQESIHILFGVIASIILFHTYKKVDSPNFKYYVAGYIFFLAFASVFRSSWFLWSIALIPLGKNRKEFFKFSLLSIILMSFTLIYAKIFYPGYPYGFRLTTFNIFDEGFLSLINLTFFNFAQNLEAFFWGLGLLGPIGEGIEFMYLFSKYLLVFLSLFFLVKGIRTKEKFALAVGLIGLINILAVLFFYDTAFWREHRPIAPCFFLFVFSLVTLNYKKVTATLLALMFVFFLGYIDYIKKIISLHKASGIYYHIKKPELDSFKDIANFMEKDGITTVLLSNYFVNKPSTSYYSILMNLPLTSKSGYRIRYTVNWFLENYKFHNKIPIDFILTNERIFIKNFKLIHSDSNYFLYKNMKETK